ncbi:SDR family oxidoreductase [Pacificimonas sp. WHA3]|uniref:SDR family oxidoreductase n=1 Tax=Pacificimonas pallii TaxID=2827236 RepID=A0ABS6SFW8_9SPHN|nr:SDR family NAD(P)-dependent oxidoreductase [Pacificimonas pallii]MBV7257145.1 SDR family oxidoreductase [Pacificimonas pallii]
MSWMQGKRVLVTGGTQGIGQATAALFRDAGAKVTITGTRAAASDYDGEDLAGMTYLQCRMTDKAEIDALAARFDALDALVNNAGMGRQDEYEQDAFEEVILVNLSAVMKLSTLLRPALAKARGSIVNVGSLSSFLALKETPAYTASKAGILGLTRALADKWAPDGIRVNMVAPGFIETRMTSGMRADAGFEKKLLKAVPMRRWGAPEEVAECIAFLAGPGASYVTGQSLAMDGGLMLR